MLLNSVTCILFSTVYTVSFNTSDLFRYYYGSHILLLIQRKKFILKYILDLHRTFSQVSYNFFLSSENSRNSSIENSIVEVIHNPTV